MRRYPAPVPAQRTVIITGANSGIGLETAVALATRGDRVVLACRNPSKAEAAVGTVVGRSGSDAVELLSLDLASFGSIRAAAAEVSRRWPVVDVLVDNAGLMVSDWSPTAEGFETTFGVNHLGHFLFTNLLEPQVRAAAEPRVIVLSSTMHRSAVRGLHWDDLDSRRRFNGWLAYGRSKLANLMFSNELARRWPEVTVNAVHPGSVGTNFGREGDTTGVSARLLGWSGLVSISAADGARTSVHLATTPVDAIGSGGYWQKSRLARPSSAARRPADDRRLWEVSEQLIGSVADSTTGN